MDPVLFENGYAGRVVQAGEGLAAYWAFVPNPLPPQLSLRAELADILAEAERAIGELARMVQTVPNPQTLIRPFVRREAMYSARIEGIRANMAEIYTHEAQQALPGQGIIPLNSDVQEVLNYVTAIEYGLARLDTLPISLRLMKELHERLMAGVRGEESTPGEFRRSQNWIGAPGCKLNDAGYVPPPVPEMLEALYSLEAYFHTCAIYPPLIRTGLIHYQFEAIHPFLDGNGRLGRLLVTLLLHYWDLLPYPVLYLSAYFDQHRQEYYDRLMDVSRRGAWQEWLNFYLEGVVQQAEDATIRARQIVEIERRWSDRICNHNGAGPMDDVVDILLAQPWVVANDVARQLGMTPQKAVESLDHLADRAILRRINGWYGEQRYLAEELWSIVQ